MNISKLSDLIAQASSTATAEKTSSTAAKPSVEDIPPEGKMTDLSAAEMSEVVQKANQAMIKSGSDLKFSMDQDNGKPVVQIIDRETDKVLRQIPSVEMLALSKALEKMQGVLMSRSA